MARPRKSKPLDTVSRYPAGSTDICEWVSARDWTLIEGDERDPDAPLPVFLSTAVAPDGRLVCSALIVGVLPEPAARAPGEITARLLRELHLPKLVMLAQAVPDENDEYGAAVKRMLARSPAIRPGPRGHPDEHFREVAAAYLEALQISPRSPVKYMAEQMDRPEVTIRRWLQRARDKGYLGASTPGRAGQQPRRGKR